MAGEILYLGDTSLAGAAGYLAGLITHFGYSFEYVPSDRKVTPKQIVAKRKLIIVSDYPSKLLSGKFQTHLLEQVSAGTGLLMIGGWESYHGFGGNWDGTKIGGALPVAISPTDDRQNFDQPAIWLKMAEHPIVGKLPWDKRPPTIGGLNRVKAKRDAHLLITAQQFSANIQGDVIEIEPSRIYPLLVAGSFGKGRTAALATDLAPHWVGGFVDWGTSRVKAKARGSWQIEVGNLYAQFVKNLLSWTGKL